VFTATERRRYHGGFVNRRSLVAVIDEGWELEKAKANVREHGNEPDPAYEKERELAWDELEQARENEQEPVKENEDKWERATAWGQVCGKG
jgi:hypothetical protein